MRKSNIPLKERHREAMAKYRAKHAYMQLPKDLHAQIKVYCDEHALIMSKFVTNMVRKEFKNYINGNI